MHKLSSWAGAPGRNTLLWLFSVSLMYAQPQIQFSDLESGPNSGGQNGQGAFVSIYGARFGATRGGSSVTVGGQPVASYPVWTDTKVTFQLGAAAATGEIKINTTGGTSNGLPFTVRPGNIYFVAPSGSNTAAGTYAAPWKTVQKAVDTMAAGDIAYLLDGLVETRVGTSDGSVTISRNFGAAGRPKALVGYPGAVATIGSIGAGPCTSTACIEGIKTTYASDYWTIANLRLFGNDYGLVVRGKNWRVIGNEFTCPNGNGASACLDGSQAVGVKVFGNNIHDTGFDRSSALYHGIYFSTDSNLLDIGWNSLTNVKGCRGIQIHSSKLDASTGLNQYGIDIHDNFIKDTQCDAIVLATIDPSKGAIRIFNNVIVNGGRGPITVEGGGNYACIYVAGYTNNGPQGSGVVEIYNNTMVNCGGNKQLGYGGVTYARRATTIDVRMRNNIIVQPAGQPYWVNFDAGTTGMIGANNLFFGNGAPPANPGLTGTLNVDPKLVNAAGGDYHLLAGSPAIGAGVETGLAVDKDGLFRTTPPDLGAYQFTAGTVPPPPPPPQPAQLALSTATVTAAGTVAGTNPAAQPVTLSNVAGGSTASWSANANQPWVKIAPVSGSLAGGASQPLSVTFDSAGLAAGSHSATITFTGGSTPPALAVTLNLTAAVSAPNLVVTPASLSGSYTIGGSAPAAQNVVLRNDGGSTAAWSATPAQGWLKVTPASGSLAAGASVNLSVTATPGSLAVGSYNGTINVTGGSAARAISYALTVAPAPTVLQPTTLGASPTVMGFVGISGRPTRTRPLVITNTGTGTARWTAGGSQSWLRLSLTSGTLAPGESVVIIVSTETTGLASGIHAGRIVVLGGTSPVSITVQITLVRTTTAELRLAPGGVNFPAPVWLRPRERKQLLSPFHV